MLNPCFKCKPTTLHIKKLGKYISHKWDPKWAILRGGYLQGKLLKDNYRYVICFWKGILKLTV